VLHPRGWHGDFHRRLTGTNLNSSDLPRTRDVTRDFVTAQLVADAITALDVDDRARRKPRQRRQLQRLLDHVKQHTSLARLDDRQTYAVNRDASANLHAGS